jgi:putative PIN family toxin of toxin-antitoxin system
MRIVCDTNVLVSGILFTGHRRTILRLAAQGRIENCISPEMLDEVEEVLRRPKFHLGWLEISGIIELFQQTFAVVVPTHRVRAVADDPDDDAVLEAALEAKASWIVSGDHHLRNLACWRGIEIASPADFARRLVGR